MKTKILGLPLLLGTFLFTLVDAPTTKENTTDGIIENDNENVKQMCVRDETLTDDKNSEYVFSYTDVLRNYYELTHEKMNKMSKEMNVSFKGFCENYYKAGLSLEEYVGTYTGEYKEKNIDVDFDKMRILRSRSSDESYILKNINDPNNTSTFNPTVTPTNAFQRDVVYYNSSSNIGNGYFSFSNVKEGDILIETDTDWYQLNMGHCAFIYNINKAAAGKVRGRSGYIQTIEAVGGGVQFGIIDDQRMVDFGCVIVRPRTTITSYRLNKAKDFCLKQVGLDYALPTDPCVIHYDIDNKSNTFYCSELVYAAYKYAGITVGRVSSDNTVFPMDILHYSDVKYVNFSDTLEVELLGKVNGKWNFKVMNYTGRSVTLIYNEKLCFASDAYNWKKLNHTNSSITIPNNSYTTNVMVGGNVFATTAAMSYVANGKRYITYANELSGLLRPTVRKNIIRA